MALFKPQYGNHKIKITPEGGLAVRMINKTGAATVKGYLASANSTDLEVIITPIGRPDIVGVFYENDVADGLETWIVVNGIADVFFVGNTVAGQFARMCASTDTGKADGKAIAENAPASPFATDKHFQEIGHIIESRTGPGLAKVITHYN